MDKPGPDGKTLIDLFNENNDCVVPSTWINYYKTVNTDKMGEVPFRVWQIFDDMVSSVTNKQINQFICAAGILAHYVGDASQTLHGSYMSLGIPQSGGRPLGARTHATYEDDMVNAHIVEINAGVSKTAPTMQHQQIESGKKAATATVALMVNTNKSIPPKSLIDTYMKNSNGAVEALWNQWGPQTIDAFSGSVILLASIWESAWKIGDGENSFSDSDGKKVDRSIFQEIYSNPKFIPSVPLEELANILKMQ